LHTHGPRPTPHARGAYGLPRVRTRGYDAALTSRRKEPDTLDGFDDGREESQTNMSGNVNGIGRVFVVALTLLCVCASARAQLSKHESGFAEVNGGRLYYEALGKGPAVLLVHGGLVDSRMWDAQMKPLSKHFRVVRFDIRGYGRSPAPTGEYYPHEDIRILLDYLKGRG
jgi:predicted alpha/beta-fold hydrolase